MINRELLKYEPLSPQEVIQKLASLPEWDVQNGALIRVVKGQPYARLALMVSSLAHLAERANHHPSLTLEYESLTITFSTHETNSLTSADFEMARCVSILI